MSLQKYIRQLRPIQENKIDYVDVFQNLHEGRTTEATLMENVIVACWNNRNRTKSKFATVIIKDKDVKNWYKVSKLANYKGTKLGGPIKDFTIKNKNVIDALYSFSQLLKNNAPAGTTGKMSGAGKSDSSTSAFWGYHTGKTKDTSKADIMIGKSGISVKGLSAVLMSGVAAETKATALAAFARATGKSTLTKLQQNIVSAMEDMIGSSDRIDIEAPPEAKEKNTKTMGQLTVDDAIKYGLQKKDGGFTDDRWLTVGNVDIMQNASRGEKVTDWTKVNYDVIPAVKVKDADGKSFELTDDAEKKAVVDRINTAAANAITSAKQAKVALERDLKIAFNDSKVQAAFAWEAMSGWGKFNSGAGLAPGEPPAGQGGTGFANQMLAFDWGLERIAWYEIKENGPNVVKTAKQMTVKFDLKGGSYQVAGAKAGYSFSQALRFGIKYVNDKTNDSALTMEEKTQEAKQMLSEGLLNEWSFWKKLKKIWKTFVSTLKVYWEKFVNFLKEIKDKIVEIFDAGVYSVLNYFELDVKVEVNTKVRLL